MFLPLGDDVDNRTLPTAGIFLVLANVLVCCWMVRMLVDHPGQQVVRTCKSVTRRTEPALVGAINGFGRTPETREFIMRWGLIPRDLQRGRYEGVFTHMFLHADLMHLIGNMVVLWAFVHTLEAALGPWTFCGCFVLWGLIGGVAQTAMNWGGNVPLIGASGAIAGMVGAYWVAFGSFTRIRTFVWFFRPRILQIPAGFYVAFWIFTQLEGIIISQPGAPGVAWYAHLGGFVSGALTMVVLRGGTRRRLVQTYHGNLELREIESKQVAQTNEELPEEVPCPYCGTPVDFESRLADNLVRCTNDACRRLVLLDLSVATA